MSVRWRLARSLRLRIASMIIDARQLGAVLEERETSKDVIYHLERALDDANRIEGYLEGQGEDELR